MPETQQDFSDLLAAEHLQAQDAAAAPPPQEQNFADLYRAEFPDAAPQVIGEKAPTSNRGRYWSGGFVSDVFDTLSTMQYAAAGLAAGKTLQEAVASRSSWGDLLPGLGMEEGPTRDLMGLAGDIILDPAWVINPAKVGNLLGKVEIFQKAGAAIRGTYDSTKVGQFINENFKFAYNVPEAVKKLYHGMLERLGKYKTEIRDVHGEVAKFEGKADEFFRGVLETKDPLVKDMIVRDARAAGFGDNFENATIHAEELDKKIGKDMVEVGKLDRATFEVMTGQHLRREYKRYADVEAHIEDLRKLGDPASMQQAAELEYAVGKQRLSGPRERGKYGADRLGATEHRTDISEGLAKQLGRINDVGYRVAKGALAGATAASEGRFLNGVFEKYAGENVAEATQKWLAAGEDPLKMGQIISMPESPRLGALSGKALPRPIANFVNQMIKNPTKWEQLIRTPYSYWRLFKVVANPAGQARNFMANLALINFAGVESFRIPDLYVKAWRLLHGGEVFADAAKQGEAVKMINEIRGAMDSSFVHQELDRVLTLISNTTGSFFSKARRLVDSGLIKASNAYRFNEVLGKTAAGIRDLERGGDFVRAVNFGERALFNYAEVPQAVDFLRRKGIVPFASFAFFATDATARAMWTRPATLTKFSKAFAAIEAANPLSQQERAAAPQWQKQFGNIFLGKSIPGLKDKYGRSLVFDATYIIPFADIAQATDEGIVKHLAGMAPFPTLAYDLATNRSMFTGRQIAPSAELTGPSEHMKGVAIQKYLDYIYKFAMPSWMPSILPGFPKSLQVVTGGYAFKNMEDAILQRPDVFGKTKDWKATVMGEVFGLKVRPFDLPKERANRAREYKEQVGIIQSEMKKVAMDRGYSSDEKQRLFDRLREDLLNVHRAWRTRN